MELRAPNQRSGTRVSLLLTKYWMAMPGQIRSATQYSLLERDVSPAYSAGTSFPSVG